MRDQVSLRSAIEQSSLLKEEERIYWLEHLPAMNTEQCEKLMRILRSAKDIPWQRNMETYLSLLARGVQYAAAHS